jgi:3-phosphoglycerate kinase
MFHYLKCIFCFAFQGRPKGVTPKYSLAPLVPRLSELIGIEVCYRLMIVKE